MTPFRLLPWEHRGVEPAPSFLFDARLNNRTRRFAVRARQGRVYFRLDDEDERIWALEREFRGENVELELFWRGEVEAERATRFFVVERAFSTQGVLPTWHEERAHYFHSSNLNMMGPTILAVAVAADGTRGWAQEWCGGPWFPFALKERDKRTKAHVPSVWSRSWNAARLKRALAPLGGDLAFRLESQVKRNDEPLRWALGSQHQLETLFRAACICRIASASQANPAVRWLERRAAKANPFLIVHSETVPHKSNARQWPSLWPSLVPDALVALFLQHNLPVGGAWSEVNRSRTQYDEDGEPIEPEPPVEPRPKRRLDWTFSPHWMRLEAEIETRPSAHEHLEAHLLLREWLRDKAPREHVEEWLG